jgi:hypothetical protein
MKKLILFILLLLSLYEIKCNKDGTPIESLPPITTNGANTFGCKVDGKVWLPYGGFNLKAITVNGGIIATSSAIQIFTCNRKNGAMSDLDITLNNVFDTGTYKIYNKLDEGLLYSDGNSSYEPFDTFGIVHISRCDTVQKIISGTFSFTATDKMGGSPDSNKTVKITDGRFDLHYPLKID